MDGLESLALRVIADRCARESELFFQRQSHDPRFCFELFRRAIVEHLHCAWELVYAQYKVLVTTWVTRHPAFSLTGEETAYFVNRAFERMWTALTPEKFEHFPDLKSILRYLQMCVHSVVVDFTRNAGAPSLESSLEDVEARLPARTSTLEEQVEMHIQQKTLWNCLAARLHNEKERSMLYGSFVLNLKPQELLSVFPHTFRSIDEIYQIKQNVLDRLRRDPELKELLKQDG